MYHHSGLKSGRDPVAPRSSFYQGPFGRICGDLPPWEPPGHPVEEEVDDFFFAFAQQAMIEAPSEGSGIPSPEALAADPVRRDALAAEFGSEIPAGYTYFGQFVDHDITFDPASSLVRMNDPNALLNFRTPRLDLDNLYGRGPDDQPYLYDQTVPSSQARFLIGPAIDGSPHPDLPRNAQGRALIGDMRNDENSVVSQLQLAFLRAHNELVQRAVDAGDPQPFATARRVLRWLYQWIVWHDFLARVTQPAVHDAALTLGDLPGGRRGFSRGLKDVYSWKHQPFMPVEFSVAAYRFGHSMVRNAYQTNIVHGFGEFKPIFANVGTPDPDDLRGFRPCPASNVIEWDWFLPMGAPGPFPQKARKIDTKLANALTFLHEGAPEDRVNVLAYRNLKRSWTFELPAGSVVARKFCVDPVALEDGEPDALWYYILKEAETVESGERLGPVGSTIVCATFAGLLAGDPSSWINMDPCWMPDSESLLTDADREPGEAEWKLSSIIRIAGAPVSAADF